MTAADEKGRRVGVATSSDDATDLDWLNDEAAEQVGGVDDGEGLQEAGGRRTTLVPVAAEHAERQHVADETDDAQRTDDVHVDEQLVLDVVTFARRSRRPAAVRRHT